MFAIRYAMLMFTGAFLAGQYAFGGNFGVSPIRVEFDRNAKTGAITVTNEDQGRLQLQMRAFEWTQDTDGKDVYRESSDLIIFPKLMTLQKQEQRLIRAGLRGAIQERERTYRLFIEEIPQPRSGEAAAGAQVAVAIRFGVPVFVKPVKEITQGTLDELTFEAGKLRMRVRNTGNVHFMIDAINIKNASGYFQDVRGWYLLAGAARGYTVDVPRAACLKSDKLDVIVKTDRLELKGSVPVDKSKCGA